MRPSRRPPLTRFTLNQLGNAADEHFLRMEWPVALTYPNGRVHETTIDAPADFGPGHEFNAYGRRWRALDAPRGSRRPTRAEGVLRLRCRSIEAREGDTPA